MTMMMTKPLSPEEVRDRLQKAHALMLEAFVQMAKIGDHAGFLTLDAAFACGEAAGSISKAKALIERDIDAREEAA
jgi:hypothetical protein